MAIKAQPIDTLQCCQRMVQVLRCPCVVNGELMVVVVGLHLEIGGSGGGGSL